VIAVSIETIVAIGVPCVALLFTVLTFSRNTKRETESAAAGRATMTADISYIRTSIDEIKVDNKVIQKDVSDMKAKLVEVEASAKSAHKRLDDLNAKG
jgi:peptidoglycan hydrolase CwlO-like protein